MKLKKSIRDFVYKMPYFIDKISYSGGFFKEYPGAVVDIEKIRNPGFWKEYEHLIEIANETATKMESEQTVQNKISISKEFAKELIDAVNKSTNNGVNDLIKFNPFCYDISYLFISKYGDIPHRASQYWHHDSVGDRLKIFLDLGSTAKVPTIVDNQFKGYSEKPQMFMEDRLKYKPILNNISELAPIIQKTIVVLNTNWMHAGSNAAPNTIRSYLCIELSNNFKTLCKGRVGRRNKP